MNRPTEEINNLKQFVADFPLGNSRYGNEISWTECKNLYEYIDQLEKAIIRLFEENGCPKMNFKTACHEKEPTLKECEECIQKWVMQDED